VPWSKPLPSGVVFTLDDSGRHYLHHRSEIGEFFLASDAVVPTFSRQRRISNIINQISPEDLATFNRIGYTIVGMMLFPGNRIGRTINGARGFHPRIKDRFDLTVECIRRVYCGERSPLAAVLARYAEFFALFVDFHGYVEHFQLQDLVSRGGSVVKFFALFEDFATSPLPESVGAYRTYSQLAIEFIRARNLRILRCYQP
jgi:hypothetical protein